MWRRWYLLMNLEKPEKSGFWKKEKKIAGDIVILHMCTKSHNHMKYSSRDMELYRIFLVILGHFFPFYTPHPPPTPHPLKNPENQNFEKMKIVSGDVIILNFCNKKCMLTRLWRVTDVIFYFKPSVALLLH